MLEGLLGREDLNIRILCPGDGGEGKVNARCSYAFFSEGLPYVYLTELETQFRGELDTFQPDVIHVWGTEYGHTLAMVNAAEKVGRLDSLVVSIQGLCSVYAGHYAEGVPESVQRGSTFRDVVRRDNIVKQREKFVLRGKKKPCKRRAILSAERTGTWPASDGSIRKQSTISATRHCASHFIRGLGATRAAGNTGFSLPAAPIP